MKSSISAAIFACGLAYSLLAHAGAETATLSVSGSFREGDTVTYTTTITNTVDETQSDLSGHEFSVQLPPGITIDEVSLVATSGAPAYDSGTVLWDGVLNGQESVTITFAAAIDSGTAGMTISMQGRVEYASDFDGGVVDSPTDDPQLPGTQDPTNFIVAATTPVRLQSFDVE